MEDKWMFVSALMFAGQQIGIWIKGVKNPEDPAKFLFETKAEEMTNKEIMDAQEKHGIDYFTQIKPE